MPIHPDNGVRLLAGSLFGFRCACAIVAHGFDVESLDAESAVGEEATAVEEVCEPFLVRAGMVARTTRGRVATPQAWTHLGMTPPPRASGLGQSGMFD